jgi:hypothetical protein
MAKNIKLKDLLNEQDPRIAGYTTPKDRYFMSPNAAFDKLTKGAEKAAGKDSTDVSPEYTGKARLNALAGKAYKAPNGLEYPQYVIGGIPNKFATVSDDVFVLDLSATPTYPLLKANPPKLSSADAKIIVNKGRTEPMREYDIEQIAEKIYNTKGYIYDEETGIKPALESYRFGIQSRGDFAFLENTFANNYQKTLEDYVYEYSERDVSEDLLKWLRGRTWMTTDVFNRWGDSLDRINDWALSNGTINDFFLWAISPTRRKFLENNFRKRDISVLAKIPILNWLTSKGTILGDLTGAEWTAAGQPGNESQILPFDTDIHTILTTLSFVADFIPIIGIAISAGIDLLDAGIYAAEGDTYSASMSLMCAALPFMPNLSGPLRMVVKKFSKADLAKFGAKLGKGIDAATYMKLSRRELELLYEMEKNAAKLTKAYDDKIALGLAKYSNKFGTALKNGTESQRSKFAQALVSAKNSKTAKAATKFAEQSLIMNAAEWALRKANQVTDAEIDEIHDAVVKEAEDYLDQLLKINISESVSAPWYSKYMKPDSNWKRRSISQKDDMLLSKLLEDVFSEQISQNWEKPETNLPWDADKKPKKKNTATISADTTAQALVPDETGELKIVDTTAAMKAAEKQAEADAKWIDASSLSYILFLVSTGVGIYAAGGAGKWFAGTLGKFFPSLEALLSRTVGRFNPVQWRRVFRDKRNMKRALRDSNLTLTKKEYDAMCRSLNSELQTSMKMTLEQVKNGTLSPEEAIKEYAGLTRGKTFDKLEELRQIARISSRARATQTTPPEQGTSNAYGRSNIGFGRSGD